MKLSKQQNEVALLSCVLKDEGKETMPEILAAGVTAEWFSSPKNGAFWDAFVALHASDRPIDCFTVRDHMDQREQLTPAGGDARLLEIDNAVDTASHLPAYLNSLKNHYLHQRIRGYANKLVKQLKECPPDEIAAILPDVEAQVYAICSRVPLAHARTMPAAAVVQKTQEHIAEIMDRARNPVKGVRFGVEEMDRQLGFLDSKEITLIAARPGCGKTSIGLQAAINAAVNEGKRALFFSLEMSAEQLGLRALCMISGVSGSKLRNGFLTGDDQSRIDKATKRLAASQLYVDDESPQTVDMIASKTRRIISQHGALDLLVVDYLQYIRSTEKGIRRDEQIAITTKAIKDLAKSLGIPILLLSQLNRDSEKDNRPPRLSDLAESGSIEKDSATVISLFRPKGEIDETVINCEVLKSRHSARTTAPIKLRFNGGLTKFESIRP